MTVRVPTHKDGTALFWEFATDHYDLAFGLFFEWSETEETKLSIHISDTEDEMITDTLVFSISGYSKKGQRPHHSVLQVPTTKLKRIFFYFIY